MLLSITGFAGAIAEKYIPILNNIFAPAGLKILALAHTSIEGFFPGSKAYRTNNPGNIGTTAIGGTVGKFPSLADGTAAQINYLQKILDGKHRAYPLGGDTTLAKYINTYAPPIENNSERYISLVIATFKKQGIAITRDTKLKEIAAIGDEKKKRSNQATGGNISTYNFFRSVRFFVLGK